VSDIPEHFTIELPAVPVHLCGGREKTPVSRAGVCANAVHGKHFLRVLHVPHLCDRPLLDHYGPPDLMHGWVFVGRMLLVYALTIAAASASLFLVEKPAQRLRRYILARP